jgi:hypothetical protein
VDDHKLAVYRFQFRTAGQVISPGHMWGTREAIATLKDCELIASSERTVHRKLLDMAGFYYEDTPSLFQNLEDPARLYAA